MSWKHFLPAECPHNSQVHLGALGGAPQQKAFLEGSSWREGRQPRAYVYECGLRGGVS